MKSWIKNKKFNKSSKSNKTVTFLQIKKKSAKCLLKIITFMTITLLRKRTKKLQCFKKEHKPHSFIVREGTPKCIYKRMHHWKNQTMLSGAFYQLQFASLWTGMICIALIFLGTHINSWAITSSLIKDRGRYNSNERVGHIRQCISNSSTIFLHNM